MTALEMGDIADPQNAAISGDGSRGSLLGGDRPPDAAVELIDVHKRYGKTTVLRSCSLRIHRGQFVSLLGPSGSGKTTILRVIAGLVAQDAGRVLINGNPVDGLAPNKRPVNTVFQNYALFPHQTVLENVRFPLEAQKVPRGERHARAREVLRMVAMDGMEDKAVTKLSGGQAQRVALARALAARPQVLLLDEPLSALDLKLRHAMQLELRRIHEASGTTFIFVTHDQGEALAMSDRVILMREGQIVQDGPPEVLYDQPSTPFASDFLGAANLLDGVVRRLADDSAHVEVGGLQLAGRATVPLNLGDDVVLSIRPERISVLPGERTDQGAVTGAIERTVFLGHIVRCIVRLDGCDERLTAEGTRAASAEWKAGLTVSVAWAPTDAQVMTR